jgi:hypothetical protein
MPDKRYVRGCGTGCVRCWYNRLAHGNPQGKKWLAKHPGEHCWLDEAVEGTRSKKISRYYVVDTGDDDFECLKREPKRIASKNSRRSKWAEFRGVDTSCQPSSLSGEYECPQTSPPNPPAC